MNRCKRKVILLLAAFCFCCITGPAWADGVMIRERDKFEQPPGTHQVLVRGYGDSIQTAYDDAVARAPHACEKPEDYVDYDPYGHPDNEWVNDTWVRAIDTLSVYCRNHKAETQPSKTEPAKPDCAKKPDAPRLPDYDFTVQGVGAGRTQEIALKQALSNARQQCWLKEKSGSLMAAKADGVGVDLWGYDKADVRYQSSPSAPSYGNPMAWVTGYCKRSSSVRPYSHHDFTTEIDGTGETRAVALTNALNRANLQCNSLAGNFMSPEGGGVHLGDAVGYDPDSVVYADHAGPRSDAFVLQIDCKVRGQPKTEEAQDSKCVETAGASRPDFALKVGSSGSVR